MPALPKKVLEGQIALVAGATRGAGRGIAIALGEAGATVYCTGRSSQGRPATPGRPETIQETAKLVTSAGGRGIAVRVDHTEPAQVKRLMARIRRRAEDAPATDEASPLVREQRPWLRLDNEALWTPLQ